MSFIDLKIIFITAFIFSTLLTYSLATADDKQISEQPVVKKISDTGPSKKKVKKVKSTKKAESASKAYEDTGSGLGGSGTGSGGKVNRYIETPGSGSGGTGTGGGGGKNN